MMVLVIVILEDDEGRLVINEISRRIILLNKNCSIEHKSKLFSMSNN